ncbi:MAG: N-acetylmuramoyl-L-alanine amidase, partial [Chloroflexota bacterium]|nr:N-acetylmuramoyl-L-alanine amidase [Chloroflexota bacterium]
PRPPAFPLGTGALAGRTLVLDAGHGGRDPGAVHHGVRESDVNLAVARELRPLLEEAGARVVLTRDGDQAAAPGATLNAELQARVSVASRVGADLFVSIHANAHEDRDVQGAITFYGREAGFVSGAQRPPRLVARSRQLAGAINRELVLATGEIDRGTRSANFWVLGGPRVPAVLVEVGFLTNAEEAARLATPSFQRFAAQGIAAGVARYLGTEEDAQFVADVTLGDGADVIPGEALVKTWRVRNTGATTWGAGYRLTFHDGDALGGPSSLPLPLGAVVPGAEVDVSVPLVAGAEHAGRSVTGQWQLQSPDGGPFGDRLWVSVRAGAPGAGPPVVALPVMPPATSGAPARPPVLPLPTDRVAPLSHPEVTYAEATGHNLGFGFRRFFETFGGLDLFGYPRTEEMQEGGFTVQYFQRARFEYHPEHAGTPYEVQLGLLGDLVTAPRRPFPAGSTFESGAQHRWYPETGHGVHYAFLTYFDSRGGLDVFGYPISEELPERNDDGSGRAYTVQYFQRARFEYHPEHAGTPYEVQLGLLGDQRLQATGWLR